jgi:hypothetical protein
VRRAFAEELRDCLWPASGNRLDLCVVLSLRNDYLGHLDELSGALPHDVFAYRYRIRNLDAEKATLTITEPAKRFGLAVEEALVERLVADLEDRGVEPANLQIVLHELVQDAQREGLWDAAAREVQARLAILRNRGVVRKFGDEDRYELAHKVYVDAFYIGKYPVTNAEYAHFMADRGRPFAMPAGKEQHPVVSVSWYDARDYADWAGMRLPTEAEWEKAASWEPGDKVTRWQGDQVTGSKRRYLWGDKFDKTKCNTNESGVGTTTPVRTYSPAGDSPCGAADMAGNVWEWCSSQYKPYPYRVYDGREDLTINDSHVLQGGSWNDNDGRAAAPVRKRHLPNSRFNVFGVRVCAVLPPP